MLSTGTMGYFANCMLIMLHSGILCVENFFHRTVARWGDVNSSQQIFVPTHQLSASLSALIYRLGCMCCYVETDLGITYTQYFFLHVTQSANILLLVISLL